MKTYDDFLNQYLNDGETQEEAEWMARRSFEAVMSFAKRAKSNKNKEPREITCQAYERAMKRQEKEVAINVGRQR